MNNNFNIFAQITKFDEEQRIVEGYASTEALDSDGEVITREAISRALPDYMKLPGGGNLREMHSLSAAGKVPQAKLDDKGLYIQAKVIDDNAWKKCKERVYTGFSIGGKKLSQIGDRITDLVLGEISLVDRPANPEAMFSLIKFDKSGDATQAIIKVAAQSLTNILNEKNMAKKDKKVEVEEVENEKVVEDIDIKEEEVVEEEKVEVIEEKKEEERVEEIEVKEEVEDDKEEEEVIVDVVKETADKISDISKRLDTLASTEDVEGVKTTADVALNKANGLTDALTKAVTVIESLKAEIEAIKKTAMPVKTVSPVVVSKSASEEDETKEASLSKEYSELLHKAEQGALGKASYTEADQARAFELRRLLIK